MTNGLDILINLSMELQAIAQNGLAYTTDKYDKERFERIREISAQIMSMKTELPLDVVKDMFCNETGYQTPKIDTRAAVFCGNKVLLVEEQGKWALPGGWVDYNESIAENIVKEEAGLDVSPVRLIAVQDRNKHNLPKYAYGIVKIFVLCAITADGGFQPNNETTARGFFAIDELPVINEAKVAHSQIQMCFDAYKCEKWEVLFD